MPDVPELLRRNAGERGAAPALSVPPGSMTYEEWLARSTALALALEDVCPQGAFVALPFGPERWVDFGVAYLGVQLGGCIPVPLPPALSAAEWEPVIDECAITLAVIASAPDLGTADLPNTTIDDLVSAAPSSSGRRPSRPSHEVSDVIHSSGTTGRRKAVVTYHSELLQGSRLPPSWIGRAILHSFPPFAFAGVHGALLLGLRSGVEVRTIAPLSILAPDPFIDAMEDPSVVMVQVVPALATAIVRSGHLRGRDLGHIGMVMVGGAATPPSVLEGLAAAIPSATVVNTYGTTEAGTAQLSMPYDPRRPAAVGRSIGRTEVQVVDDRGAVVGPGVLGEICLRRAAGRPRAYLRPDAATDATRLPDGWVRTGDLGHLDGDGYLYVADRKKDVIIRGGRNISSAEVEDALLHHDAVAEAAVIGEPGVGDERIVAYVVPRGPVEVRDLRGHVGRVLSPAMVPQRIHLVDALPRNAMGKVEKAKLRRRPEDGD